MFVSTLLFLAFLAAAFVSTVATSQNKILGADDDRANKRPNIIFILTDDQDKQSGSLDHMYGVQHHLINQGAIYEHHYCTVALCCPSRVNLWTGQAAHNTNVTDLAPPYGGYDKFVSQGLNDDWLPIWMQNSGYNTYYVGKLFNQFSETNYNKPFVKGFNGSDFLCGPGVYNYYNPVYQRNHDPPKVYRNQYTTDLTLAKGLDLMEEARASEKPFFLTMAPVAPHSGNGPRPAGVPNFGPVPKKKFSKMFQGIQVPRSDNFNPDKPSGTSWLLDIEQLDEEEIMAIDRNYRLRLQALQSVDKLVNKTMKYLEKYQLLDNTYVIYSSDNGFHLGHHRLKPGKNCPYEEDINVPLIIRGPGIKAGSKVEVATSHTDLAPTILLLAGGKFPDKLDGRAVPLVDKTPVDENFEHAQIEHWGDAGGDEEHTYPGVAGTMNTTYRALRIMGEGYNYYYSVWCSNQHEMYDMNKDPGQMNNLYGKSLSTGNANQDAFPLDRLQSRLDALLLVLKGCKAKSCVKPWEALHPAGDVKSLKDAMKPEFDNFYEKQQHRVSFDRCMPGYITSAEGPQTWVQYSHHQNRMSLFLG